VAFRSYSGFITTANGVSCGMTIIDRIMAKSVWQGDCLVWTGCKINGYGRIGYNGINCLVHRLVYMSIYGPTELDVLHLFVGDNYDNVYDKVSKGRQSSLKGVTNGTSKLTEDDVRYIRGAVKTGTYIKIRKELAKTFGVSTTVIYNVVNNKSWTHVS
jgi:hypothetical protein